MAQLLTSISQIKSFNPCPDGFDRLLKGRKGKGDQNTLFPISETCDYCHFSDITWLLGKLERKDILVLAARKVADSVAHLNNRYSRRAAAAAAAAAAYAADADAAYAAADADAAAADAYAAAAITYEKQKQLNLQLLKESIELLS